MNWNKYLWISLILFACNSDNSSEKTIENTVCNPVNISYRFRPETNEISRREAADPTVIKFKGEYWLFASKSGGYWFSKDLALWSFVKNDDIPTEDYAPTAVTIGDTIYLAVSSKTNDKVYKTSNPHSGQWLAENTLSHPTEDPCFYLDTDDKLYLYWGCSNENPLYGAEIDPTTFKHKSDVNELIFQNPAEYGWEVRGDHNTEYDNPPWLEGLWMTKENDKYYLQYSAPGTREKSYADGVYEADGPLGPFTLAQHNPFSYKPEGFACGAGHGSTITDEYGNYWHLGTISISVKHKFERRIGFYPAFIDNDSVMFTQTQYGDYPIIVPNKKADSFEDLFPGWMLLSYNKKVKVSSILDGFRSENMLDENIRTYWAAKTGGKKEWAIIDLDANYDMHAIQINFAEHNTQIFGRQNGIKHRYIISVSNDQKNWIDVIDKSESQDDNSHDYVQLKQKINCRYVRIKNIEIPGENLAISGLRVFGKGFSNKPRKVEVLKVARNSSDKRSVELNWTKLENATGYNISYGFTTEKLYHNYMVYNDSSVTIRTLNSNQEYYFTIEAFNENGITPSSILVSTIKN